MSNKDVYRALCVHWDHHPTLNTPHYGAGTDAEQIRRYLRAVRPDVTQYHSIGCKGYVNFPSKIAPAVPGLVGDPLQVWSEACAAEGVALGVYAAAWAAGYPEPVPQWRCVNRAGVVSDQHFCPNGPWTEEFFIPLLLEIMDRYHPVHFWLDGVWLQYDRADYCYCEHCQRRFRELYGRELPRNPTVANWAELQPFHERSLDDAVARVARAIKGRDPGILLACNSLFYYKSLRPPIPEVDWLSWDILNTPNLHQAAFEASYLATAGRPADIMIYEHGIVQWEPHISRPRTLAQLKSETAALLAHGIRLNLWHNPNDDGSIDDDKAETGRELAGFVRVRQDWCIGNDSAAEVAVLASRLQHCCDFDHQNTAVRAAHQLLQEAHVPCDIVHDDALLPRLEQYRLLILPEVTALSPETAAGLHEYLTAGGCVFSSATELLPDFPSWLPPMLGAESGFEPTGTPVQPVLHQQHKVQLGRRWFRLAGGWRPLMGYEGADEPWLAEMPVGKGRALAVTSEVFADYADHHWPGLRELVAAALREGLGPEPLVEFTGPAGIEIVVNRRENDLFVHLVNLTPGNSFGRASELFFDSVPVYRDLEIIVRPERQPQSVTELPAETSSDWQAESGALRISVPELRHHVAVRLAGAFT